MFSLTSGHLFSFSLYSISFDDDDDRVSLLIAHKESSSSSAFDKDCSLFVVVVQQQNFELSIALHLSICMCMWTADSNGSMTNNLKSKKKNLFENGIRPQRNKKTESYFLNLCKLCSN